MSMVLMQRKATHPYGDNDSDLIDDRGSIAAMENSKGKSKRKLFFPQIFIFFAALTMFGMSFVYHNVAMDEFDWTNFPSGNLKVAIEWSENSKIVGTKTRGPHRIHIVTSCPQTIPYVIVGGDVFQSIRLSETKHMSWSGEFMIQSTGKFELKLIGSSCKDEETLDIKIQDFEIKDDLILPSAVEVEPVYKKLTGDMFSNGAWIASSKLNIEPTSDIQPATYVWTNPASKNGALKGIDGAKGFVVKEGSLTKENGFYEFRQLSNYELVCFFGSQSAKDLHESLLSLRGNLFTHQRPFKFHYYEVNDMANPDSTWDEETKKRFRKCKHILVSIDDPEKPISQTDYSKQMTTLLTHLTKAFDDETFPIWVFSSMESPIRSKHCFDAVGLRSTEHPCNVVLKKMFVDSPFSDRVRFLDNTDISMTLSPTDELFLSHHKDMLGAVALRIYIIVGYQVKLWRENKQVGHINGLTRGDIEYPNFELLPYNFAGSIAR